VKPHQPQISDWMVLDEAIGNFHCNILFYGGLEHCWKVLQTSPYPIVQHSLPQPMEQIAVKHKHLHTEQDYQQLHSFHQAPREELKYNEAKGSFLLAL
jgi:hypothetical protein